MDDIIIKRSRSKAIKNILLSLYIGIPFFFGLLFFMPDENAWIPREVMFILGIAVMLLIMLTLVSGFRNLISPKIVLVISENGFTDNSTWLSRGFTPWEHVEDIYVDEQQFIAVVTNDDFEIQRLDRMNIIRQLLFGAGVHIHLCDSEIRPRIALKHMRAYLAAYRSNEEEVAID